MRDPARSENDSLPKVIAYPWECPDCGTLLSSSVQDHACPPKDIRIQELERTLSYALVYWLQTIYELEDARPMPRDSNSGKYRYGIQLCEEVLLRTESGKQALKEEEEKLFGTRPESGLKDSSTNSTLVYCGGCGDRVHDVSNHVCREAP